MWHWRGMKCHWNICADCLTQIFHQLKSLPPGCSCVWNTDHRALLTLQEAHSPDGSCGSQSQMQKQALRPTTSLLTIDPHLYLSHLPSFGRLLSCSGNSNSCPYTCLSLLRQCDPDWSHTRGEKKAPQMIYVRHYWKHEQEASSELLGKGKARSLLFTWKSVENILRAEWWHCDKTVTSQCQRPGLIRTMCFDCAEFVCSPCDCMGFFRVLWFPPTIQIFVG